MKAGETIMIGHARVSMSRPEPLKWSLVSFEIERPDDSGLYHNGVHHMGISGTHDVVVDDVLNELQSIVEASALQQ